MACAAFACHAGRTWEVRTAGADTNGGGFVSGGTDYSQNDNKNAAGCSLCGSSSANLSTTDAVANGTTTITSASANFTSAITGNMIYLQGGSGSLAAGWYQTTYASSTSITVDRTVASGTAITMNIGGALATAGQANANSAASNTIYIKSGTYMLTSTVTLSLKNDTSGPLSFIGYHVTRGDNDGARPVITSATANLALFTFGAGNPSGYLFQNIKFSHTGGTRGDAFKPSVAAGSTVFNVHIKGCVFDGMLHAIEADWNVSWAMLGVLIEDSEIKNSTSDGIVGHGSYRIIGSYIHDNAGDGIRTSNANSTTPTNPSNVFSVSGSVIRANANGIRNQQSLAGSSGGQGTYSLAVINSAILDNTADGIVFTGANDQHNLTVMNNVIDGNGGYGLNMLHTPAMAYIMANAFRANTQGNYNNSSGSADIILTGDPFTNRSSGDFSLNATAGSACRNAGIPGTWSWGPGTGSADIGPYRHADAAGAITRSYPIQ